MSKKSMDAETAKGLAVRSAKDLSADGAPHLAASIAYYAFLSLFPLLLAFVAISSFFVQPQWAVEQIGRLLEEYIPEADEFVQQTIEGAMGAGAIASLVAIPLLLWTGSRVFRSLTRALNIVFDAKEYASFWKRLLIELLMTIGIGFVMLLALTANFFIDPIFRALNFLPVDNGTIYEVLRAVIPALLLLTAYFLIYYYVPRRVVHWKSALFGAVLGAVLFMIVRWGFMLYVQNFAEFNLVYGALGMAIVLMIWAWLVAFVTLVAGSVASHYQMMIVEGMSEEEVKRIHEERSPVVYEDDEGNQAA
jgi:membrane protein